MSDSPAAGQLASTVAEPCRAELALLGGRLLASGREVLVRVRARGPVSGVAEGSTVHASIERTATAATEAIAAWLAGEPAESVHSTAQAIATLFGQLAVARAAPLNELTRYALRWRDAVNEILTDLATGAEVSAASLNRAHAMVQQGLEVMLVRLGEAFESERSIVEDELVMRQQELVFLATHDSLTGLPNRTLIMDRADQMLARARRKRRKCAALLIDLDGFKSINDALGPVAGDALLKAVAERLSGTTREADTLGRLGTDEFVVLVDVSAQGAGPEAVAERVRAALSEPFALDGLQAGRIALTTSMGIATGVYGASSDLLRDAGIAMYRARLAGRNNQVVFEHGMADQAQIRLQLEMAMRETIGTDRFYLVYQPMLYLRTLAPVRMEALLRWRDQAGEVIPPDVFIPVLEQSGLITEVGRWVLAKACEHCAAWQRSGAVIGVAVNVSAVQLETGRLVADVADALLASQLDPGLLTIEITETTLMRDAERTMEDLRALKRLGVRLSIDDFGTGYSSLAYLQRFPVDELKIDRSFVSQIGTASQHDALIRTLVALGRSLRIQTLAEGIEEPGQLARLQAQECDLGQGYLFARPMEVERCGPFMREWAPEAADAAA
ncbi:MAG: putative bifunctional diguanylate cyclase/phosphodiesterase [Solirubrobacteraceae bacterium]